MEWSKIHSLVNSGVSLNFIILSTTKDATLK
jgi:hypothetical protein